MLIWRAHPGRRYKRGMDNVVGGVLSKPPGAQAKYQQTLETVGYVSRTVLHPSRRTILSGQHTEMQKMMEDLQNLEKLIEEEDWFKHNRHEPNVGAPESLKLADKYGTRGKSLFTAYVTEKEVGVYGCVYEPCFAFSTRNLEEAIRHIRHHHFSHTPFSCGQWYVSHYLLSYSFPCTR